MNYRQLAKECPRCMGCDRPNPDYNLVALAHSNRQADGRGFAHKSIDELGAFLAWECCHQWYDQSGASRQEKDEFFKGAWERSIKWAITKKGWRLVRVE